MSYPALKSGSGIVAESCAPRAKAWAARSALVSSLLSLLLLGTRIAEGATPTPDPTPANEVVVAAVHAHPRDASKVDPECNAGDTNCAVAAQVRAAAARGARLIVTAEYALDQSVLEPQPERGQRIEDPKQAPLLTRFGTLASEVGAYLVINLRTQRDGRQHNTQVAFDPRGRIAAVHDKFELYGGENDVLTPGRDVTVFDTPFGRIGLLICADLYGDPSLHQRLSQELEADIVAVSSQWTVAGATRWQAAFAKDWGMTVVAANASGGAGKGSGVFLPSGEALAISHEANTEVLLASVPVEKPLAAKVKLAGRSAVDTPVAEAKASKRKGKVQPSKTKKKAKAPAERSAPR